MLGYDQNVLISSIFVKHYSGLLCYHQPFPSPTSVECLGLNYKVQYSNANQGIIPESHNIWVQLTENDENDLVNTFQGQVPAIPVLYFPWTPPDQNLWFEECLPAGKTITTLLKMCRITQQSISCLQAPEYAVLTPPNDIYLHSWADWVAGVSWVVIQTNMMHILPIRAIVGLAHFVRENAASDRIDSTWLEDNHVDCGSYCTIYWSEYLNEGMQQ